MVAQSLGRQVGEQVAEAAVQVAQHVLRGSEFLSQAEQSRAGVAQPIFGCEGPLSLGDDECPCLRFDDHSPFRGQESNGFANRVWCRAEHGSESAVAGQLRVHRVLARLDVPP